MNNQPAKPIVVGLGELLWDCFSSGKKPGGAPANFAFHAGQLGCEGVVCSRVGQDQLGDELVGFIESHGLSSEFIQRDPDHPTGTVTVDDSRPHDPSYTIHENVAWDHLAFSPEMQTLAEKTSCVCFGTLAQRSRDTREAIARFIEHVPKHALVVYDINLRQDYYSRELIEDSLRMCTLVKLNDGEVNALVELFGLDVVGDSIGDASEAFARCVFDRFHVQAVCVTMGAKGCMLIEPGDGGSLNVARVPGKEVDVADTVGAGDSFTAAWAVARMKGWDLSRQARLANEVGAMVASSEGAMPPLADAFVGLLKGE